jgi:hypothetical protein
MDLFRLYAYPVEPQRTVREEEFVAPGGSRIDWSADLEAALAAALGAARGMTTVDLRLDTDPQVRSSPIRDAVMRFGFEYQHSAAERSARELASHLSRSMDERSKPCLFLAAAYRESAADGRRRVALWIFPRDEAFRFHAMTIELLNDVFSRSSRLRKLALFDGRNVRTNFLQAQVLDFQAGGVDEVARFWIDRFLDAQLSISDEAGTRLLATTISRVSETELTVPAREQLQIAALAVRTMPQRRWSLEQFANRMLSGELRDAFLAAAPNDESRRSVFGFQRQVFEDSLRTRIFRLDTGVTVLSPLEEVGQTVQVVRQQASTSDAESDGNARGERLTVEGTVVSDRMSKRRA